MLLEGKSVLKFSMEKKPQIPIPKYNLDTLNKIKSLRSANSSADNTKKPTLKPLKYSQQSKEIYFSFGTGVIFSSVSRPLESFQGASFKLEMKKVVKTTKKEEVEPIKNEEHESGLVISGNKGEENEEILFDCPVKLYIYDRNSEDNKGQYVCRCNGILHFNKADGFYRIVIRNGVGVVCMNTRLFKGMSPSVFKDVYIRFFTMNDQNELQINLVQFKTKTLCTNLFNQITSCLKNIE